MKIADIGAPQGQKLESMVAFFATTVKEQAAQIQKVSVRMELNKPAPQEIANR